jgi:hypothetical protein
MSENQRLIEVTVNWAFKIALAVLGVMATFFINNMNQSFDKIQLDIELIKTYHNQMKIDQAIMSTQLEALKVQVQEIKKQNENGKDH